MSRELWPGAGLTVGFLSARMSAATSARAAQLGITIVHQRMGGKLEAFYYSFGEYDGVAIVELPDDTAATATILAALAPGHLKSSRTTRLMSVEETMEAMRKAGSATYAGPTG